MIATKKRGTSSTAPKNAKMMTDLIQLLEQRQISNPASTSNLLDLMPSSTIGSGLYHYTYCSTPQLKIPCSSTQKTQLEVLYRFQTHKNTFTPLYKLKGFKESSRSQLQGVHWASKIREDLFSKSIRCCGFF